MRNTRRTSAFRGILVNIGVMLAAILIMLLLAELALRLLIPDPAPTTKYHPYYVYTFNPGIEKTSFYPDLNRSFVQEFNQYGWYGPLAEYAVQTNKSRRILVIGDSFASQLSLPSYEDIFSEQLESMYRDVDVVTIGAGSYAFDNEEKVLELEGERYRPEIVIFATFINDLMDTYRDNVFTLSNHTLIDKTPRKIPFLRRAIFQCETRSYLCGLGGEVLAQNGERINRIMTLLGISDIKRDSSLKYRLWGLPDAVFEPDSQPSSLNVSLEKSDLILQRIKRLAEERNYTVVFMLIPIKEQISERKRQEFFAQNPDLDPKRFDFNKPYDDIRGLIIKNGFPIIDLYPVLKARNKDNDFYYEIDGHWNRAGHTLVALQIYKFLNQTGLVSEHE